MQYVPTRTIWRRHLRSICRNINFYWMLSDLPPFAQSQEGLGKKGRRIHAGWRTHRRSGQVLLGKFGTWWLGDLTEIHHIGLQDTDLAIPDVACLKSRFIARDFLGCFFGVFFWHERRSRDLPVVVFVFQLCWFRSVGCSSTSLVSQIDQIWGTYHVVSKLLSRLPSMRPWGTTDDKPLVRPCWSLKKSEHVAMLQMKITSW